MPQATWNNLAGTSDTQFGIGFAGPLVKSNGQNIEFWDPTGTANLVIARAAMPVGPNDLATKQYVDNISKPTPAIQYNGGTALIANSGTEQWYVVTTAGTVAAAAYVIGTLLYDNGTGTGNVQVYTETTGDVIITVGAFAAGTITLLTNTIYVWNGTAWVQPTAPTPPGGIVAIQVTIGTAATASSTSLIPAGAKILSAQILVGTPYDVGATISLGYTGSVSAFFDAASNNAQSAGLYIENEQTASSGTAAALLATVTGTPTAGAAVAIVTYATPLV